MDEFNEEERQLRSSSPHMGAQLGLYHIHTMFKHVSFSLEQLRHS